MPVATAGPGSPGLGCVGLAPAARCSHLPKVWLIFQLLKRQVRFAERCLRAEVSGYPPAPEPLPRAVSQPRLHSARLHGAFRECQARVLNELCLGLALGTRVLREPRVARGRWLLLRGTMGLRDAECSGDTMERRLETWAQKGSSERSWGLSPHPERCGQPASPR